MKRILLLFSLYLLTAVNTFAQKRSIGYLNAGGVIFAPWETNVDASFFPAFTITPGLKLFQQNDFALVLNFPVSAGVTYKTDAFAGIDLPVMLSFNFGSAAGNNKNATLGFIAAAGMGYINVVNDYDSQTGKRHTEFLGFRFNAGISFKQSTDIVPSIIFSYGRSIRANGGNLVGIGLQLIMCNL